MKRRNASSVVVVSLTVVVSILIVAFTASLSVRRRAFDRGVNACFVAISMRDPKRDASVDARLDERRFFFDFLSEFDGSGTADGVMLHRNASGMAIKSCSAKDHISWRELPFRSWSRYTLDRFSHPTVDPYNSPKTACGEARKEYIRAYNAEMARISPNSIARYCRS